MPVGIAQGNLLSTDLRFEDYLLQRQSTSEVYDLTSYESDRDARPDKAARLTHQCTEAPAVCCGQCAVKAEACASGILSGAGAKLA